MTCAEFLSRLQGVRRSGNRWMARCPAHEDENASLSVAESGGKILLHDFGGCATEAILAVMGLQMSDLFIDSCADGNRGPHGTIKAVYDYTDEAGKLLFQVVRHEPKDFRQRRSDGKGGWIWNLNGVRRVLYRLPEVLKTRSVLICEGEKDCETAHALGLVATTNPGGAGKWRDEYAQFLKGKRVCVIADADAPGAAQGRDAARSLVGVSESVRLIEALPGVPHKGDLTDFIKVGGTREKLLQIIKGTPALTVQDLEKWTPIKPKTVWDAAAFVTEDEADANIEFLESPVLAPGHLTLLAGPGGLGKTNYARWLAVKLARAGKRVLYLDRDNPPRKARQALRDWGGTGIVKLLCRDKVPALLRNDAAWEAFPVRDYDALFLDSWDSTAEGAGEKDSRLPSIAISHILDIVHSENGPGVLVLMNVVKDGTHSRNCGVIEDRADAKFEARDLTDVKFSGEKGWWEEIPVVGVKDWAKRATRRREKERFRMGLVPNKFKIDGPEPSPLALEIDFTTSPFSIRDITDEIDAEGAAAREQRAREKAEATEKAVAALVTEVSRRGVAKETALLKKQAEEFLTNLAGLKITQQEAREITESKSFELVPVAGKGHSKAVQLASEKEESNRNSTPLEPPKTLGENDAHFGCPPSMHPTEIGFHQSQCLRAPEKPPISVAGSLFTPAAEQEDNSVEV